jgi:hypothetical protein
MPAFLFPRIFRLKQDTLKKENDGGEKSGKEKGN